VFLNARVKSHRAGSMGMHARFLSLIALCFFPVVLSAQSDDLGSYQIYGAFTSLSNSFNGVPGSRQPLFGWEASVAFPAWHHLRPKLDYAGFNGTNLGSPQHAFFIMAGGEYEYDIGRERLFGEALFGDVGLNQNWGANGSPGSSASFSTLFGGGLDTPVSKHFAIRFEGGYQYTNFALYQSLSYKFPYRIPGLPNNFGRFSSGLVWIPHLKSASGKSDSERHQRRPVESELVYEAIGSVGHYHLFADSWWSNLHTAGVEYDRNSWGKFIGAQMDYTADIMPVAILTQPSKTDVWGDPLTTDREHVPGLAFSPIGLRMLWRDGKRVKPYYMIKGGLIGFTKKALSENATYENFTLQQSLGAQFKLTDRWDFRTGFLFFHFSDGFIVTSNPGLDSLTYNAGLSYHLGKRDEHN
jgi:opacity protein-like surface antigen